MQGALSATGFDRRVRLDGCFNFRDVGDYRTVEGAHVRSGRLFRADGPRALTTQDAVTLDALRLATVIDLRTPTETAEQGRFSDCTSGFLEYQLPVAEVLPTPEELAAWADPRIVAAHYRELLSTGHDSICEALAILTDPGAYPVLVHCSAGKDRTGVLCAIVLGMLGVPDQLIIDDYALSGPAMVNLVELLQRAFPDPREQITQLAPAITAADPASMQWFLADVRAEYGSMSGYVESLGMESSLPYVRACLLASTATL